MPASRKGAHVAAPPISKQALETTAERVFVTHPRIFSFTHRSLASLRHPNLPLVLHIAETDLSKPKRNWQSKAERISDLLTDGMASRRSDEERWAQVAAMLDTVLFEPDIDRRRQHVMESAQLRRILETWWCKAGGTTGQGISEATYRSIHTELYRHLLQLEEMSFSTTINKAVEKDFEWDSDGEGEVTFGRWCISILEVADNWISTCDGDAYGAFLHDLMGKLFPEVEAHPPDGNGQQQHRISTARPETQATLVDTLRRTAMTYRHAPLIRTQRTMRHTVEYVKVPSPGL